MSTVHSTHHHGHTFQALIDWEHHHDTAVTVIVVILAFLFCAFLIGYYSAQNPSSMNPPNSYIHPTYTPYY